MLDWKRWGDGKSLFGSGGGWGDLGGDGRFGKQYSTVVPVSRK